MALGRYPESRICAKQNGHSNVSCLPGRPYSLPVSSFPTLFSLNFLLSIQATLKIQFFIFYFRSHYYIIGFLKRLLHTRTANTCHPFSHSSACYYRYICLALHVLLTWKEVPTLRTPYTLENSSVAMLTSFSETERSTSCSAKIIPSIVSVSCM